MLMPLECKVLRVANELSQQDLAKLANVALSTIADFERGKSTPIPNNMHAIEEAL